MATSGAFTWIPSRGGAAWALPSPATMDYLESIDCTRALLHASPQGRPIYLTLGFEESNELALDLPPSQSG